MKLDKVYVHEKSHQEKASTGRREGLTREVVRRQRLLNVVKQTKLENPHIAYSTVGIPGTWYAQNGGVMNLPSQRELAAAERETSMHILGFGDGG
jgi:hypothetical protein